MVEVLIAMLIGVFLLGGILTLVQNTRLAATTQGTSTTLQDSARLGLGILTDVIQQAGYFPDPAGPAGENLTDAFGAYTPAGSFGTYALATGVPTVSGFPTAQFVSGTGAYSPLTALPADTLAVRYVTGNNDGVLNCSGTSNTSGGNQTYVNAFAVDAANNLTCTLTTLTFNGTAYTTVSTSNPITLVPGVKNFKVRYGVRTSTASACDCADGYLDATQMTAANWANVVAVQITLTFANPVVTAPAQPDLVFSRIVSVMSKTGQEVQL
jgi:type IV pilus assembly protein PilW